MKFASPGFDMVSDFFGHTDGIKMSVTGNQWFVAPQIVAHFESKSIKVYIEALPSVLVRKRANGAPLSLGNLQIDGIPELVCIDNNLLHGMKFSQKFEAFEDHLCIAWVETKEQPDICKIKKEKLAIPNPRLSSAGMIFKKYYEKNCGYYGDLKGVAIICDIHHREIPQKIMSGTADYGILWESEARYWKFKYYVPDDVEMKFSWILAKNSSQQSETVFNAIKSGVLSEYYNKYQFKNILQK